MSQILSRLTPAHFKTGWSVYWRISLPFWIHAVYILVVFSSIVFVQYTNITMMIHKWFPITTNFPFIINIVLGIGLYFLLYPLIKKVQSFLTEKAETQFFRSQFGLFSTLDKFNRGIISLIVAFFLLLIVQWKQWVENFQNLWIFLFLFVLILVGAVLIFVAFYGWLTDQMDEVKEALHGSK